MSISNDEAPALIGCCGDGILNAMAAASGKKIAAKQDMDDDEELYKSARMRRLNSLLRLFESEWFDMALSMHYLAKERDPKTHEYLCDRLEGFSAEDLEFWLPQMIAVLFRFQELGQGQNLHEALVHSATKHIWLALRMSWWLTSVATSSSESQSRREMARNLLEDIQSGEPRFPSTNNANPTSQAPPTPPTPIKKNLGHRRSRSLGSQFSFASPAKGMAPSRLGADAHALASPSRVMETGRAFVDRRPISGITVELCLRPQLAFISALMTIGEKLRRFKGKDVRRNQLHAELELMNLNLPARVSLPQAVAEILRANNKDHHIVRIPPHEAAVLNSRDRVPYVIYVEVLECSNCQTSPLPEKCTLKNKVKSGSHSLKMATSAVADSYKARQEGKVAVSDIRRRLIKVSSEGSLVDLNDPSAKAFREPWTEKVGRIRLSSPYGHLPNWKVVPIIIKNGDDLRQEVLASQLMAAFQKAWQKEGLKLWVKPLGVVVTESEGGMIEVVPSGVSLHQIKNHHSSILSYFKSEFGSVTSDTFLKAQEHFVESLAGYSLYCYFVQVKDRHNSNILLDAAGHIIHIDFGFMLSTSPGGGINFENAPFKLTEEFIEVLGGAESDIFKRYRFLVLQGFRAARKHMADITPLLELLLPDIPMPCLLAGPAVLQAFKERFMMNLTESKLSAHVDTLIDTSIASLRTQLYDRFQYLTNGIR
eukprot:m.338689 g.338689  ORF g.338689 m.338689 type:complete len:708 (-) comp18505_c0_seq1:90-2213(-)